jgi:cyclic pyranopterin phosphate synthase
MTTDHLDEKGAARMLDVSGKPETRRVAVAEAVIRLSQSTRQALFEGQLAKGDALAAARIAAIGAAKKTSDLVPLCHPLPLTSVDVEIEETDVGARVEVTASTLGRTGVEMEAITGAALGAITIYDMVKSLDRGAEVGPVRLVSKTGGKSGDWSR